MTVADRGPGIAPADLEGIFEPFITTKRHGVGLGLPICRTIVDSHGGRIWATNNPDGGATLHFEVTHFLQANHRCRNPRSYTWLTTTRTLSWRSHDC